MRQQDRDDTMQIGEVAERAQLSLRTIRHYDEIGLAPPSARSEGGFRLYTKSDVDRLIRIRRIKPLGFSLDETTHVLRILEGTAPADDAAAYLLKAREARDKLARKLQQADEMIVDLETSISAEATNG
ncbi:MerR family transcriptional regulator [Zhihengliuella halotolerans]|uniref:MerR family transcriptional regulator n=1 Tax=Zhihengliuella halotolerans TaxID=370736 RepID=UPI000C7FB4D6|nr:MerR family transcriptional regulator [Zhihengliuella halotolerans]